MDNFELMKIEAEKRLRKPDLKLVRSCVPVSQVVNAWSLRVTITFIQYMTVGIGQFIMLKRITPRIYYSAPAAPLVAYNLNNFMLQPVLQSTGLSAFNNIDFNNLVTEFPGIVVAPGFPGHIDGEWPLATEQGILLPDNRQIAWQFDLFESALPAGLAPAIGDSIDGQCEFEFISF